MRRTKRKSQIWHTQPKRGFPLKVWNWAVGFLGPIRQMEYESLFWHWSFHPMTGDTPSVHGELFIRRMMER